MSGSSARQLIPSAGVERPLVLSAGVKDSSAGDTNYLQVERNKRIIAARYSQQIHAIVAQERLNYVNVATAVSRLAKIGSVGGGGEAWTRLRSVVVPLCAAAMGPREVANIIHGYARLRRCGLAVEMVRVALSTRVEESIRRCRWGRSPPP